MSHLKFRNVNDSFRGLVEIFRRGPEFSQDIPIVKTTSRNGNVLQITEPMIITYEKPLERVLFNQARDCNPFFHLYESLWMLAGRNDVAPLAFYNSKIADYSDDGQTFNGAYGYRWRTYWGRTACRFAKHASEFVPNDQPGIIKHIQSTHDVNGPVEGYPGESVYGFQEVDQIKVIIDHLKRKPDSRRAVLHMSNVEDDLLKMDTTKDQCCNLACCFSIGHRSCVQCGGTGTYKGNYTPDDPTSEYVEETCQDCDGSGRYSPFLDMTVFNRSNDTVWGMLGANVVHFSFLQEYMAAHLEVEVGVYNQISNNLHVYEWNFKPDEWLEGQQACDGYSLHMGMPGCMPIKTFPLIENPAVFDEELPLFVEVFSGCPYNSENMPNAHHNWKEPFLQKVASPMCWAFRLTKTKQYDAALSVMKEVASDDWRIAGANWIQKRKKNWEAKQNGE